MKAREQYLSTKWSPYPVLRSEAWERGRYLGEASPGRLWLWRREERLELSFVSSEVTAVLVPGDLISIDEAGYVALIAPRTLPGNFVPLESRGLKVFNQVRNSIRRFFETRHFLELRTPSLVICPGTEPSLDVFETEFRDGSRRAKRFLPTSPELHLKKALAGGFEKIFEIKTCFRNGEITEVHQPEFEMLEWYRAWAPLKQIEDDVVALIEFAQKDLGQDEPLWIKRASMRELFLEAFEFELTPMTSRDEYLKLAQDQGLSVSADDSIDDLFFRLFTEKIETQFDPKTLTFVFDWPPFQAALARVDKEGWAERFEVYWQGLEIANAFHELNDPDAQMIRFKDDLQKKKAAGKSEILLDPDFEKALRSGLPPSSGIALGVERLAMALSGIRHIHELRAFPELRSAKS